MSPITFKQQVEQLVSELAKCIQLCQDIRAYRKIGNRHENLDRLQSTLESAEASIPMAYNTTRRLVGSQFELGDEKARAEMDRYIVEMQTKMKPKLREIAQPSRRRHRHEREQPGFRELLSQWKSLYQEVSLTMLALSRRIETADALPDHPSVRSAAAAATAAPAAAPSAAAAPPAPRKPDEITISLKDFDHLLQHLKRCWEERLVDGQYVYVNVHDPSLTQWAPPPADAYVRARGPRAAPRLARSPSYERCSPRSRASS